MSDLDKSYDVGFDPAPQTNYASVFAKNIGTLIDLYEHMPEPAATTCAKFLEAKVNARYRNYSYHNDQNKPKNPPTYRTLKKIIDELIIKVRGQENEKAIEHDTLFLLGMKSAPYSDLNIKSNQISSAVLKSSYANEISWLRFVPSYDKHLNNGSISAIEKGVDFFENIVGMSESRKAQNFKEYLESHDDITRQRICSYFRRALWAGAIQVYDVKESGKKAEIIRRSYKEKYNIRLREVHVAKLPIVEVVDENTTHYINVRVICSELVAQLAARVIFHSGDMSKPVGISAGYTLERMAFHMVTDDTRDFTWYPLQAFIDEQFPLNSGIPYRIDPRSANGVAVLLRSIYLRSEAIYLPYIPSNCRKYVYQANLQIPKDCTYSPETVNYVKRYFSELNENANVAVVTVTGRRHRPGKNPEYVLASADGESFSFPLLQQLHERLIEDIRSDDTVLDKEKKLRGVAGALLATFIDKDGNPVGSEKFQELNANAVFSIGLNWMVDKVKAEDNYYMWCVAGGKHKREAVLAAIRGGYVNSLVIDEWIADYLISEATEK